MKYILILLGYVKYVLRDIMLMFKVDVLHCHPIVLLLDLMVHVLDVLKDIELLGGNVVLILSIVSNLILILVFVQDAILDIIWQLLENVHFYLPFVHQLI